MRPRNLPVTPGEVFGSWTVIKEIEPDPYYIRRVECKCNDCGRDAVKPLSRLRCGIQIICRCGQRQSKVGEKYSRLTVVKCVGKRTTRYFYECLCECGKTCEVEGSKLENGHTKSCGCIRIGRTTGRALPAGESMKRKVFASYKSNARNKGLPFHLTLEDAESLFQGNCHYCGCAPCRIAKHEKSNGSYTYNGIDRKNGPEGYVLENCVSCCTECNYRKSDAAYDDFVAWIKRAACNLSKPKPVALAKPSAAERTLPLFEKIA